MIIESKLFIHYADFSIIRNIYRSIFRDLHGYISCKRLGDLRFIDYVFFQQHIRLILIDLYGIYCQFFERNVKVGRCIYSIDRYRIECRNISFYIFFLVDTVLIVIGS